MGGSVDFAAAGATGVARLTLANPGKHNAIDIGMWQTLRARFAALQQLPPEAAPRYVLVCGDGDQFASGGDIDEFAGFRFDEAAACSNKRTLRQIARGGPTASERHAHFGYADSAEHREGITAFIAKRPPRFLPD